MCKYTYISNAGGVTPQLTVQGGQAKAVNVVRKTDDVNTFLQTVDLAGVPQGTVRTVCAVPCVLNIVHCIFNFEVHI